MIIVGIDPGLDGAFSFFDSETREVRTAFPMPARDVGKGGGTQREVAWDDLVHRLNQIEGNFFAAKYAFIERVNSMPKQGVASSFKFGRCYGGLECLLACRAWANEFVTPNSWKRKLAVPATTEDEILKRASQLLPSCARWWRPERGTLTKVRACGVAEATLIAFYGSLWLEERGLLNPRAAGERKPRLKLSA